jgi:hypothetical protein
MDVFRKIKKKYTVHRIPLHVYPASIYILLNTNIKDICKSLEDEFKIDLSNLHDAEGGALILENEKESIKVFSIILTPNCKVNTIYHEALHMSWYILDYFGVALDANNHEAQTYLQSYIGDEIIKFLKTLKKNK